MSSWAFHSIGSAVEEVLACFLNNWNHFIIVGLRSFWYPFHFILSTQLLSLKKVEASFFFFLISSIWSYFLHWRTMHVLWLLWPVFLYLREIKYTKLLGFGYINFLRRSIWLALIGVVVWVGSLVNN
jgi:hypothetical protein